MSGDTSIEWTDAVWNPTVGCTRISEGCRNCYAFQLHDQRHAAYMAGKKMPPQYAKPFKELQLLPDRLEDPLHWRKPRRVFVNSMSDLFHEDVPEGFIDRVFRVMFDAKQHTFQVLTKRAGRMAEYCGRRWGAFDGKDYPPAPNVWLGVSVENQAAADERIPHLLRTPAAVRFLSCEPLLGPVNIGPWLGPWTCDGEAGVGRHDGKHGPNSYCGSICRDYGNSRGPLDWVICGGESGPKARPMHPNWARSLRDQCQAAGVPFFFKQWGEYLPVPVFDAPDFAGGRAFDVPGSGRSSATMRLASPGAFRSGECRLMKAGDRRGDGVMLDDDTFAVRLGKKAAGRLLDGREWNEFPEVSR